MTAWIQIIIFIVTHAPSLIRAIRDLIDLFQGDRKSAAELLKDLHKANTKSADPEERARAISVILDKHRRKIIAR